MGWSDGRDRKVGGGNQMKTDKGEQRQTSLREIAYLDEHGQVIFEAVRDVPRDHRVQHDAQRVDIAFRAIPEEKRKHQT